MAQSSTEIDGYIQPYRAVAVKKESFLKYVVKNKWLYIFLIPGLLYFLIFKYVPMFGIVIAFKDLSIAKGIWGSEWIGFSNFETLFSSSHFLRVLRNSLLLSAYQIIFGFPAPVILALMLNEVRIMAFKRVTQTILYLPHFISWVVLAGIVINFLSPTAGIVNQIVTAFGHEPIKFLQEPQYFRSIIVSAEIWKGVGWGTIIYLAAMTGIDPTLYESAKIDGASRMQRIFYITIPGIATTVIIMLLLNLGNILDNGFEQVFLLYNPVTYETGDIFETYTYRIGLQDGRLSYATAVGLFKSVVGFMLIISANYAARKISGKSIW
ncbi:putative aldouronate transport system permease protein [Paenibacillus sp. UNCCL117]|uniref:ABC transporter permease n=1 Tax=unclassified Paenibacillus TaxID=185978 RepID=UPI0008902CAB|nr:MULTISPECIES: ABC transporter permease subunit [unclassified Paenibacillus]SDE55418.1 putative aldouronate transport system permease protein [Paenibacillus sp. cl123]SFW66447.1 putative aldouronate transport system permease protein [Paenibacillus sp. UNCCL117]